MLDGYANVFKTVILLTQVSARSVKTRMAKKTRGSITCRTDRANEANKMFIIWLC